MNKIQLVVLVSLACVSFTAAGVIFTKGACPSGAKVGFTWNRPNCEKCECVPGGYNCYTCTYRKYPAACNVEYERGSYPTCCKALVDCPMSAKP
ncbi:U-scoloptoxin(16)-Er12a-like [Physella acuta]|uniref:U-scoloptoxin(16)-Er12a-like n=1 Tax=Physella acuta TaxID=109671 RepID=UPI0027DCCA2A|nr:U-scoloptoxin(16)-Er12a-like [Physella acuta]